MKEKELIEEIGEMIRWYKEEGATATIEDLLHCRDVIATDCWTMAEHTGEAKTEYNTAVYIRKIEVSRYKQAMFDRHETATKADVAAIIAKEGLFKAEIIKEGYAFKMDLMLRQANKILDAISQRLSYMKQEKVQTRFQDQT